jgi:hypothetical protein
MSCSKIILRNVFTANTKRKKNVGKQRKGTTCEILKNEFCPVYRCIVVFIKNESFFLLVIALLFLFKIHLLGPTKCKNPILFDKVALTCFKSGVE